MIPLASCSQCHLNTPQPAVYMPDVEFILPHCTHLVMLNTRNNSTPSFGKLYVLIYRPVMLKHRYQQHLIILCTDLEGNYSLIPHMVSFPPSKNQQVMSHSRDIRPIPESRALNAVSSTPITTADGHLYGGHENDNVWTKLGEFPTVTNSTISASRNCDILWLK